MLGSFYPAEFFQDVKSDRIRSALTRIADEEAEDLLAFETVLKAHGVEVLRPRMNPRDSILNYMDDQGRLGESVTDNNLYGIPRAPIAPRDCQFVMGNHLFLTQYEDHPGIIDRLQDHCVDMVHLNDIPIYACSYTVVNDRLLIDTDVSLHHHVVPRDQDSMRRYNAQIRNGIDENIDVIQQLYPNTQIEQIEVGAHNDGCFHTVADGAIISVEDMDIYEQTFPGWEVCYMPDEDLSLIHI